MTLENFDFLPKTSSTQFTKIYEDWGSFHFSKPKKYLIGKSYEWERERKKSYWAKRKKVGY